MCFGCGSLKETPLLRPTPTGAVVLSVKSLELHVLQPEFHCRILPIQTVNVSVFSVRFPHLWTCTARQFILNTLFSKVYTAWPKK